MRWANSMLHSIQASDSIAKNPCFLTHCLGCTAVRRTIFYVICCIKEKKKPDSGLILLEQYLACSEHSSICGCHGRISKRRTFLYPTHVFGHFLFVYPTLWPRACSGLGLRASRSLCAEQFGRRLHQNRWPLALPLRRF